MSTWPDCRESEWHVRFSCHTATHTNPARQPREAATRRTVRRWLVRIVGRALAGGLLLAAIVFPATVRVASAEDVVQLKSTTAGRVGRRLKGQIVDFTGRELRLRTPAGRERKLPASQVARIETSRSAEQTAGDEAFARGDYQLALEQYRVSLTTQREPRDWMRRQILGRIVWCLRNLNQLDQAGESYLVLLSRDPTTRDFDAIPLVWTDEQPSPAVVAKARSWLDSAGNPAARLMGASVLLTSDGAAAGAALRQLADDADPRIAWLARAQLWRSAASQAGPEQIDEWSQAIDAADPQLRAGAYFVVGRALASRDPEAGALLLMRVPILYSRERRLSEAALLQAGECLESVKRPQQAARLYRELLRDHRQTPAADLARQRLESLAPSASARDN